MGGLEEGEEGEEGLGLEKDDVRKSIVQKAEKKQFVKKIKEEIGSGDAKKNKMEVLLKHAEYYANFLLSHH